MTVGISRSSLSADPCEGADANRWDNCVGTWRDGFGSYVGMFRDGLFDGYGEARFESGNSYKGEWKSNKRHGFGEYIWSDGTVYRGEWKNNSEDGLGLKRFGKNRWEGDIYLGHFKSGRMHGSGVWKASSGIKDVGEWQNGREIGSFTRYLKNGCIQQLTFDNPTSSNRIRLVERGGVFKVPVKINETITLDFIVDSGASDVVMPADVVETLIRTGTLTDADFTDTQTYVLADGSKVTARTFNIKSLQVGDRVVTNVTGSEAPSKGSLLLGQSFLRKFKSWSINSSSQELLLE